MIHENETSELTYEIPDEDAPADSITYEALEDDNCWIELDDHVQQFIESRVRFMDPPITEMSIRQLIIKLFKDAEQTSPFESPNHEDYEALVGTLLTRFGTFGNGDSQSLYRFLDDYDPYQPDDYMVPRFFDVGDRVIVVGSPGSGKSTLTHQWAVQLASGIHPFTLESITASLCLIVDAENPREELRRRIQSLTGIAGDRLTPNCLRIHCTDSTPWDLTDDDNFEELMQMVRFHPTEVLVIGPLYKLQTGDSKEDHIARRLSDNLDRLRSETGCAIIIEAHNTKDSKTLLPAGSPLWARWPDIGITLRPNGELKNYRPPRTQGIEIPSRLVRGGFWPWETAKAPAPATASTSRNEPSETDLHEAILAHLRNHGETTKSDLSNALRQSGLKFRSEKLGDALTDLVAGRMVCERTKGRALLYSEVDDDLI